MNEQEKLFQKALNKAADILARRNHSEKELREKLARFYDEEMIETVVLEAWERRWLLPPQELAESAARSWSRSGKSSGYINEQLRKRGLPQIQLASEDELETMKTLLKKKFKNWEESQSVLSYEDRAKAYRFLKYRGFKDALIRKVIHEEP